jgi:hypothetical protein
VLELALKSIQLQKNDNLNFLFGYQFNETGMLNQTTVSAHFSVPKKDVLLNHALFSEVEYNKTIPICELDCV